jgi:hypothetical protein
VKLKFVKKEFEKMQKLEAAFKRQLGNSVYAGTNYASLVMDYSPKLAAMLRPFPPQDDIEVDVIEKDCEPKGKRSPKCYQKAIYLAEAGEQFSWECDECVSVNKKKTS